MSKEAFEAIKEGLESAISFARGQQDGHDVHEVEVRDVDVKAVRARLGMSQDDFARAFGVSPATVGIGNRAADIPMGLPVFFWP